MKKNKLVLTGSKSLFVIILSRIYPLILICIIGIIIYSNSFDCSFHFDDFSSISTNKNIHDIHDIYAIWNSGYFKRFVGYYTFALNYHFHQENVFGYHFVNLLIHICSTLLVFWLVLLILSTPGLRKKPISRKKKFIALMCSLLFLTHPVQIQAVTYIYQRLASLATLFYLASLGFYMKARLTKKKHISLISFVISAIMALLGMFTKETVFTLPFAIILFEFSLLSGDALFNKKKRTILLYMVLPLLFTIIILGIYSPDIKWILGSRISSRTQDPPLTLGIYLITQFRVIVTYIRLLFLPINQNLDYDFPASRSFFEPYTLGSFFLLVSIFVIAIRLFPNKRVMSLGILWFFLTLSIESIIPLHDVIFEYRLYLPMFGFSLLVVSTLYQILWRKNAKVMVIIIMAIISINSYITYQRNWIWANEFTLWSDVVKKSPHKARPHNNLGIALFNRGETENAFAEFRKALHINPTNAKAYNNMGYLYTNEENFEKADSLFRKAIYFDPEFANAYNNLGSLLFNQGRIEEAVEQFRSSLNVYFSNPETHNYLGAAFFQQCKYDEAVSEYRLALQIDPEYAEAYFNLGILNSAQGNRKEAKHLFYKSLSLKSDMAEAYLSLGNIYSDEENLEEAKKHFTNAIQINPSYMSAYYNLGNSYYKEGRLDKAAEYLGKALAINKIDFDSHLLLGIILRKQGKLHEAVEHFEEALRIQPSHAKLRVYFDEAVKAAKKKY